MLSEKKEILISAYAVSPYLGSEYGVGWNFISRLSEFYNITVLYGTSGERMGNVDGMRDYLAQHAVVNVEFIFVRPNRIVSLLDNLNHKVNPIFFTYAYHFWQRQVVALARDLVARKRYDLVHQLNTIGFRQPGFLWKLDLPFVWGPVGGTSNLQAPFMRHMSRGSRLRNFIRNVSNGYFLRFSGRIQAAVRAASMVFMATHADRANFSRSFGTDFPVIRENSVRHYASSIKPTKGPLQLVWAGSIDDRKALHYLLDALAVLSGNKAWQLHVVGEGPRRSTMQALAVRLGIDAHIVWHGAVPHAQVLSIMRHSDVSVITSVMDSNPTVLLEAFEMCIPTIALNHFGMKDLIDDEVGFKVTPGTHADMVAQFARALEFCIDNPAVVDGLKRNILRRQPLLHWDASVAEVRVIYEQAMQP